MPRATAAVVVCTRERPAQLARTLSALRPQVEEVDFELLVVDQSEVPFGGNGGVRAIADRGTGLSRARNVAAHATDALWLAFIDDDCRPAPGWGRALAEVIGADPPAAMVCPHVEAGPAPAGDYVEVTTFPVLRPVLRRGRRVHPGRLGFGACTVVRRDVALALGGWDERLGPGAPDFPAADDMDFNYRLLRAGHTALVTPAPRVVHDQWRTPSELPALHAGYLAAWCGFACKHLKTGDVRGGLWLLTIASVDVADMLASAIRHGSVLRLRIAAAKLRGMVTGVARGLARSW
jgi:GT2 family glycosyltransferase